MTRLEGAAGGRSTGEAPAAERRCNYSRLGGCLITVGGAAGEPGICPAGSTRAPSARPIVVPEHGIGKEVA